MMPASNQGVGMNMGFPDVCTTPAAPAPLPIPYPNIGMNAMAMPFVPNVIVSGAPGQNMSSKPMLTNGDNAGVAHPLFMQPGGLLVGNPTVLMGGMPAGHLAAPSYGNNFNNPVGSKTVPSVTNVLLASTACLVPGARARAANELHAERASLRVRDDAAVLTLPCISLRADQTIARMVDELTVHGVRHIVLDLRGNPGGSVPVAERIAATLRATGARTSIAMDRRTASAAELLAALLVDQGATSFGERSYGKGIAEVHACSPVRLTPTGDRATITHPTGAPIQTVGISPDRTCPAPDAVRQAARWLTRREDGSA